MTQTTGITPQIADEIRARGLPVAAHLSPATEPERDDGRRADLTDWKAAYQKCQAAALEARLVQRADLLAEQKHARYLSGIIDRLDAENVRLRAALAEWHRADLYSAPGVDWLLDARADRAATLGS